MYEAERYLWISVIFQAFSDLRNVQNKTDYECAKNWFENNSADFHLVCELAGLNSAYVKERSKRLMDRKRFKLSLQKPSISM